MSNVIPVANVIRRTRDLNAHETFSAVALQLSQNEKTGVSINLPLTTCRPTSGCMEYCYAARQRMAMNPSLRVQLRNLHALQTVDARTLATYLSLDIKRSGATFLRWNGSGDLTAESVAVINELARLMPELPQWIITRRGDLSHGLVDHPAIRVVYTVDGSTPDVSTAAMRGAARRFKRAAVRFAYVQRDARDRAPAFVSIVFREHQGKRRLAGRLDKRDCRATRPNVSHHDACADCGRCFAGRET